MTLKSRIEKLRTKAGLDCCACEGQPLKSVVIFPGDAMLTSYPRCFQCGRDLIFLIEIVYEQPDPPAWFTDEGGGIDAETAKQKWLEHLESQVPVTDAAANPIESDFSVAAGCLMVHSPPVSNVEDV